MNLTKNETFDWSDFIRKVAVIAIPVALQNLLTTTGSMIDTMMISSIGKIEVGAVGLCAQFSTLMFSAYWGFVGGGMLEDCRIWLSADGVLHGVCGTPSMYGNGAGAIVWVDRLSGGKYQSELDPDLWPFGGACHGRSGCGACNGDRTGDRCAYNPCDRIYQKTSLSVEHQTAF